VEGLSSQPPCYWNVSTLVAFFNQPSGISVDANGTVYVAEFYTNAVRTISLSGAVGTLGSVGGRVNNLAFGPSGNFPLYSTDDDSCKVKALSRAGVVVASVAGNVGDAGAFADGAAAAASFAKPKGLSIDSSSNAIYVADAGNNRIRVISGGTVSTVAGRSSSSPY